MARSGRKDKIVIRDLVSILERHLACVDVNVLDVAQQDFDRAVLAQNGAQRFGNLAG